jgi:hypothetical protein
MRSAGVRSAMHEIVDFLWAVSWQCPARASPRYLSMSAGIDAGCGAARPPGAAGPQGRSAGKLPGRFRHTGACMIIPGMQVCQRVPRISRCSPGRVLFPGSRPRPGAAVAVTRGMRAVPAGMLLAGRAADPQYAAGTW